MVEKVSVYAEGSRYLGNFMNFVDNHFFSSELEAEVHSDLQSVGGSNQLERIRLEEVGTAVWFISGLRLLKMKVLIAEVESYLRIVKLICALAGFIMNAFLLHESLHLDWSQFAASAESPGVRLLQS